MSEDSSETKKISKSMLLIKSDANSLKGVEQFLRNRDWALSSTHQMKDAILFLTKNKPSFVLVTVDHTNPKIRKLPKIILSAFPCCVMVYAEKSTTGSFKLLMDSGIEYKINPPVTGPAIERAVNKFIRDQEQAARQKDQEKMSEGAKNDFEFKVEIKGGERDSGVANFQTSVTSGGANSDANQDNLALSLLAQLNSDDVDTSRGAVAATASFISQQNAKTKNPNGEVLNFKKEKAPSQEDSNGLNDSSIALEMGGKKKRATNAEGFEIDPDTGALLNGSYDIDPQTGKPIPRKRKINPKTGQPFPDTQSNDDQKAQDSDFATNEAAELKTGKGKQKNKNSDTDEDISIGTAQRQGYRPDEKPENENAGSDFYIPKRKDESGSSDNKKKPEELKLTSSIVGREIDEDEPRQKDSADSLKVRKGAIFEKDSVFVKGVNQALDETVNKGNGQIQSELEDNSHLACIIVESIRFSGYLVAALGKDKKIDNDFVNLVRIKLTKFLRDNGEPIENDSNMQLKVKRVDFEGWALEYAQFLRKSVHKGDEVAMAFFPFADAKTAVGDSASQTMVSVKTEEIQTGVPIEFNLYIYLPTNKKYILYTPQGGKFLSEQKSRLTRQGVNNLHIQKDDVQNLSKFKAQNHLNSLINDYEEKQTDTKAPKKKKAA